MAGSSALDFVTNLEKDTWVHRLDPRIKLIFLMSFVVVPLIFMDPWYLGAITLLALPFWIGAKIEIKPIRGLLIAILIFSLTAVVFATFYNYGYESEILFTIGPLRATKVGFLSGLVLGFRSAIPALVVIILIATTDPAALAKGLMKMHSPLPLAFMMLGALRLFPLIFEELENITTAQTIRGVKRNGAKGSWTSFKLAALPLMVNSLRRSRVMGLAVESKGFGKRAWKEYYRDFTLSKADIALLIFTIIFLTTSFYIRFVLGLGWNPAIVS